MDVLDDAQSSSEHAPIDVASPSDGAVQPSTSKMTRVSQDGALMSPPPRPNRGNSRPASLVSRSGSKLSLSLPVQAGERDFGETRRDTPASSEYSIRQASPSVDVTPLVCPTESTAFLVSLAAQERRVFELKEELHRAEDELKKLKRQWALHEANSNTGRIGGEIKHTDLRPMQAMIVGADLKSGARKQDDLSGRTTELDRGRIAMAEHNKESRRKIITGGHTRALSLLSPDHSTYEKTLSRLPNTINQHAIIDSRVRGTSPSLKRTSSNRARHSYQESATTGVKQIAEDIKSGLWTFMEDLRQATVGDEATKGPPSASKVEQVTSDPLRRGSRRNLAVTARGSNQDDCTGNLSRGSPAVGDESRECPMAPGQIVNGSKENLESSSSLDDDWCNWDSLTPDGDPIRWADCPAQSSDDVGLLLSPRADLKNIKPMPMTESKSRRDEVTWSAFNNFTPTSIKRTASAIIKEWEKSLTPPTEQRHGDIPSHPISEMKIVEDGESRLLLNNLP